jgi:hypothetical protein
MNIIATSSSIKVRQKTSEGGLIWGQPLLDIWQKLKIESIVPWTVLKVQGIIIFDGVSSRSLDLTTVRDTVTYKGIWKVSLRKEDTHNDKVISEVRDAVLKGTGVSFLQPLKKIFDMTRTRMTAWPSAESAFKAELLVDWGSIGQFESRVKNYPKVKPTGVVWKKFPKYVGKPVLGYETSLLLDSSFSWQLNLHKNIPIWGLNRDHAQAIQFITHMRISLVSQDWEEVIDESTGSLDLPPIEYTTLFAGKMD